MNLKKIKTLAELERYDEALSKCEEFLKVHPEKKLDVLRARSYVFALQGNYENALKDREGILEIGEASIRDYYLAGDTCISLSKYVKACAYLREVLRLGHEQNETWFEASAYFLFAYAQMELGHYEEAIVSLRSAISIDPNCAMPLPGIGMWDHSQLEKEILRRAKG